MIWRLKVGTNINKTKGKGLRAEGDSVKLRNTPCNSVVKKKKVIKK